MSQKLKASLFLKLVRAYLDRELTLALSISAHSRLMIVGASSKVFADTLKLPDSVFTRSLAKLDETKLKVYEDFVAEMELVYATANFDSFLGELTRLLVISFPSYFLKQRSVSISDVLSASLEEVLNKTVREIALDIGHRGFLERLNVLQSKLAVDFNLTEDEKSELHRWARVRNALMHDRSVFEIKLDEDLEVSLQDKLQSSDVIEDRDKAMTIYRNIVAKIVRSILPQCDVDKNTQSHFERALGLLETPFLEKALPEKLV